MAAVSSAFPLQHFGGEAQEGRGFNIVSLFSTLGFWETLSPTSHVYILPYGAVVTALFLLEVLNDSAIKARTVPRWPHTSIFSYYIAIAAWQPTCVLIG